MPPGAIFTGTSGFHAAGSGPMLGAATFAVTANTAPFVQGMQQVQQQARATAVVVSQDLTKGTRNAALGFLELSRAVEDAQYGFRSIVNNIPQMVMLFGGSAGIAGAISIASVAVNQLINHWGDLTDAMQAAWSGSTIEQLKKIREGAEEAAKAWDELAKKPSEMADKGAKQLEKQVVNSGQGKALAAVLAEVVKTPGLRAEMTAEERRDLEAPAGPAFGAPGVIPQGRIGRAAVQERIDKANREKARDLLTQAMKAGEPGDKARKDLMGMDLPPDLKESIRASFPEAQKEHADFAKQVDVRKEVQNRIKAAEQAQAKKLEDQLAGGARIVKAREDAERKGAADAEKARREEERAAREAQAKRVQERHVGWQAFDIGKSLRPETKSEMIGFGFQAWGKMQTDILNNPAELQKKQVEVLLRIERLIKDNPALANLIKAQAAQGAVAQPPN